MLVTRCPQLEALQLLQAHDRLVPIDRLLRNALWPKLRRLTMGGNRFPHYKLEDDRNLDIFCQNHPSLERLYFRLFEHFMDAQTILPLRSLDVSFKANQWATSNSELANHLEFLSVVYLSPQRQERLLQFLSNATSLRSVVLSFHWFEFTQATINDVADAIPLIERIHFTLNPYIVESDIDNNSKVIEYIFYIPISPIYTLSRSSTCTGSSYLDYHTSHI
jgi:hypothetical protein